MKTWDKTGIILSTICIIHCLFFPFISASLLVLGMSVGEDFFHRALFFLLAGSGLLAFLPGLRKHKSLKVLLCALIGFSIITFVAFWGHSLLTSGWEIAINVLGSIFLILAHLFNHLKTKEAHCCGH